MPFVTVKEYTVVTVGVAVGLGTEPDDKPTPLHENTVAPPDALAFSVALPPLHIGPLLVGAAAGALFTDTEVVYTVDGLHPGFTDPSVTVNE